MSLGCAVVQLIEVLRYKHEGRGFDSTYNINEYQEYSLRTKVAGV
jgi:hypothetical protein